MAESARHRRSNGDDGVVAVAVEDPLPRGRTVARQLHRAVVLGSGVEAVRVGRVLRQRVVLYSRDEPARVQYESLVSRMADEIEIWADALDRARLAAIAGRRR